MSNCYNPGNDLDNMPSQCTKKQKQCGPDYSPNCMYNTQGEVVCQANWKDTCKKDTDLGYKYILNRKPDEKFDNVS